VWVQHQRSLKRQGRLSDDRRRRLDAVSFTWDYRPHEWDAKLQLLLAYKKRFGHCDVSNRWPENPPLAHWVNNQRCSRRRGTLRSDRIRRLDDVGFSWSTRFHPNTARGKVRHLGNVLEDHWDWMFDELVRFKKKRGHCSVPKSYSAVSGLPRWVQERRTEWKKGRLRKDRELRLKRLGFDLKHRFYSWERMFEKL
jgi:hypothetical protein